MKKTDRILKLTCTFIMYPITFQVLISLCSQEIENLEDLWDFGTIRHGGRNTIGRAHPSIRAAAGPSLTWENNDTAPRYDGPSLSPQQRISDPPQSSPVGAKGARTLPPVPFSSANSPAFQQSTIRNTQPVENDRGVLGVVPVQQGASEDYEDYDDQYPDTYSSTKSSIVQKMQDIQLEDELPDTTMLDSVVLPAIASVSFIYAHIELSFFFSLQLFPRVSTQEARVALSALQRAFTDAERVIPGVTLELVNEIVDSVEHVEEIP